MKRKLLLEQDRPTKWTLSLQHCRQTHSWDCGLSCVLMCLPSDIREQLRRNLGPVCEDEGFDKSIWTIDLCYLLARLGVRHTFYTVTLGVRPGYRANSFYEKVLARDERRVNVRFEKASVHGIDVRRASVGWEVLLGHLKYGPAVVLTNAKLLACERCRPRKVGGELRSCFGRRYVPYQGHFVVLCGYDVEKGKVFYRNPSLTDRVCATSLERFDEARRCYGTDEDVILVYRC